MKEIGNLVTQPTVRGMHVLVTMEEKNSKFSKAKQRKHLFQHKLFIFKKTIK